VSFERVARRTVADEIRDQLLSNISSGELGPGHRVPSERDLCDQFGVARTSVREAIQGLVSVGIIERRANRTYVAEHLPTVTLEAIDIRKERVRELFEVRRLIELPLMELAAKRATAPERAEVAALAERFAQPLELAEFRALDRQFHGTIALACGNSLLRELYGKVLDALFASEEFESLLEAERNKAEVAQIVELSSADHLAIAAGFVADDPSATLQSAARHLDQVEQRMIGRLV